MKKNIINIFLICAILGIIIWIVVEQYEDNRIKDKEDEKVSVISNSITEERAEVSTKQQKYPKEEVLEEYEGYKVIAKLEIPAIDLEIYVLDEYSDEALDTSVTKLYGPNPNNIGNFCIAGHNNNNGIMFSNLNKLEIGDAFFLLDNEIGKVEYEVYDIYKVLPEDTSCLSQDTNGTKEVTLITCTNDAKKRIIVKARETE